MNQQNDYDLDQMQRDFEEWLAPRRRELQEEYMVRPREEHETFMAWASFKWQTQRAEESFAITENLMKDEPPETVQRP